MTIRSMLCALSCAVLLTACRDMEEGDVSEVPAETGGTLVIAIPNEPDVANSLVSGERYGQEINRNVLYLTLLEYNEQLELAPRLAESWQMEGDTAVTFKLRRDVWWHDSVRTSAHDVAFTFERGRDPATGYPNADYWMGWNNAQVIDSFTIRFSLDPQPEALANLPWIPIMPQHLLRDVAPADIRNAPFNQRPIGNGPFKFVEHRANDRWVFDANLAFPEALGGRPYVDRLVLRIIPDPTAQETELRTGNVHLITLVSPKKFAELEPLPDIHGIVKPGRQYTFVAWNSRRPPLDDVRLRRALAHAINREEMVQVIRGAHGEVAVGPVPPYHWSVNPALRPIPFSPDSARALLAELGMRDTNNDGFVERPGGGDFRIELKHAAGSEAQRDIAELIRDDLKDVGIRLEPRPLEFGTLAGDATSPSRNFDAVILGFENDFRIILHDMFHSRAIDNPLQIGSYRNAAVDSLIDSIAVTPERAKAVPMWQRLQSIIRDEQPWTFLYYYSDLFAARDQLRGADGDIRGVLADVSKWWLARGNREEGVGNR